MRLILAVNDDGPDAEAAVQFFDGGGKLLVDHSLTVSDFDDALAKIIGRTLQRLALLNADAETKQLLADIHEAAFTRQAALPTPLHDRILDWLTKAGATP